MAGQLADATTSLPEQGRYTSRAAWAARWLERLVNFVHGDYRSATCFPPAADPSPNRPAGRVATWGRNLLQEARDSLRKRTSTDCGWPPVTGSPDPLSSRSHTPR
jgi:hypothetical protein